MPQVLEKFPLVDCEHLAPSAWRDLPHRSDAWFERAPSGARARLHERTVDYPRDVGDELSPQLRHVREAIESSRTILDLEPDDDHGEAGYSEETWNRAVEFVTKNAKWLWDSFGCVIDAPQILPGPDGSIDVHWDHPSFEMLINIPADPRAKAGFYGDDRGEIAIKGSIDPSRFNHGLLQWLARSR